MNQIYLPLWKQTGKLNAAKIEAITSADSDQTCLRLSNGQESPANLCNVSAAYMEKHKPHVGGYFIRYPDGYQSFCPAEPFEERHVRADMGRESGTNLTIGEAVEYMRLGFKVQRHGWNGKGMFIVLMPELKLPPHSSQEPGAKVNDRTAKHIGVDTPLNSRPYIALFNARAEWQPGWVCSQEDLLANDWQVAE